MRLSEGALALEVEGHIEDGFDLSCVHSWQVDEVATAQIGLHAVGAFTPAAPRTSASSAMRMTTPLNASSQ